MSDILRKISAVRNATGAAPSICRTLLESVDWDVDSAIELIRRQAEPAPSPTESPFDTSTWFAGPPLTSKMVAEAERKLGCTFPKAYLALLRIQNGGMLKRRRFMVSAPATAEAAYFDTDGLRGIGGAYGIDPDDEAIVNEDWGRPKHAIVFADAPAHGHEVFMFDYGACGPQGEPAVVWVASDGPGDALVVPLAPDMESFLQGLVEPPDEPEDETDTTP